MTEFVLPTDISFGGRPSTALDITAGPDGNIWFTKPDGHKIGRITPPGIVTEFDVNGTPYGIAAGPDGNVWFTDVNAPRIGRITPTGEITQFPSSKAAYAIVTGADGNLWAAGDLTLMRITPNGSIRDFFIPNATNGWYQPNPNAIAAAPDGSIWVADNVTSQIVRFSLNPRVLDLSVGSDSKARLLFADPDGSLVIKIVDRSGSSSVGKPYGPYSGWRSRDVSDGSDGLTRVLWTNDDGSAALWLLGPEGNQASYRLGPAAGWTAVDVASSIPGTTHVLWTDADGRIALWSVGNAGSVSTGPAYGPYPGWNAVAIADGQDGLTRVLWNRVDGSAALALFGAAGLVASHPFGPAAGWRAVDIAVGADGQTRILWTHQDGRMALWRVGGDGNPTAKGPIYPPPPGFTASRIAAGSDGLTHVLWSDINGNAILWTMSADNVLLSAVATPTPRPVPPSAGVSAWNLTDQVIAATGPGICLYKPGVGAVSRTTFELSRSGNSVDGESRHRKPARDHRQCERFRPDEQRLRAAFSARVLHGAAMKNSWNGGVAMKSLRFVVMTLAPWPSGEKGDL